MGQKTFTTKQLTKLLGATARSLRFYEEMGLVSPTRRGSTRIYTEADRARLLYILRSRRLGFSISEISNVLAMYDEKDKTDLSALPVVKARMLERVEKLERYRQELDEFLSEMNRFKQRMHLGTTAEGMRHRHII